ncbi:hypothetical protein ADMFC3_28000 [Geovibrio sp. ADMFC3]|jgi:hypothetical protein|nr:hypothetical protein [Deferribacteraceae bacterium]
MTFENYPWSTDYKKLWKYIQHKIEFEQKNPSQLFPDIGLVCVYDEKYLSDITYLYSPWEPFTEKPLSLHIGFDPVSQCSGDISGYEEFEAWAKSINIRFLDPAEILFGSWFKGRECDFIELNFGSNVEIPKQEIVDLEKDGE